MKPTIHHFIPRMVCKAFAHACSQIPVALELYDPCLIQLAVQRFPKTTGIRIYENHLAFETASLMCACHAFKFIRLVDLHGSHAMDRDVISLVMGLAKASGGSCPLESINMVNTRAGDRALKVLVRECKDLREVKIGGEWRHSFRYRSWDRSWYCTPVTVASLKILAGCKGLTHFEMAGLGFEIRVGDRIADMQPLENAFQGITQECPYIQSLKIAYAMDSITLSIASCANLQTLDFTNFSYRMTPSGLTHVVLNCKRLTYMRICSFGGQYDLDDGVLKHMGSLAELRTLIIVCHGRKMRTSWTEEGFGHLQHCRKLTKILIVQGAGYDFIHPQAHQILALARRISRRNAEIHGKCRDSMIAYVDQERAKIGDEDRVVHFSC